MNYSFMSFSCPQLNFEETLKLAKKYGYDGVEIRVEAGHCHGVEMGMNDTQIANIMELCKNYSISIPCIATSCSYSNPLYVEKNIEDTKGYINLASQLSVKTIRVFGGSITKGVSRDKAFDLVTNALRSVAIYAQQKDVTVCIETHDSWCDTNDVRKVLDAVDHNAIAVNWDIMHPVLSAGLTIEQSFEMVKPWIKHVHIHDGKRIGNKLEFLPIGTGPVNHLTAVRLLKGMGYDGFLSGEWIAWEPNEIHLPREIETMRKYEEIVLNTI